MVTCHVLLLLLTFSATINEWLETIGILVINHVDQGCIDPSTGLDAVQTTYDNLELHVEVFVEVLNSTVMGSNLDAFDPSLYESSCHLGFGLPNIRLSEEELAIEVGDIDRVCGLIRTSYMPSTSLPGYSPISMTCMSLKPDIARSLSNSQPRPPAPLEGVSIWHS